MTNLQTFVVGYLLVVFSVAFGHAQSQFVETKKTQPDLAKLAEPDKYYLEANGLVAMEVESTTSKLGEWKRRTTALQNSHFGSVYCRFLNEEFARFVKRLQDTPESFAESFGNGTMLDNSLLLFGSASSAFHLFRNYPLVLAGGRNMGFKHGRYLNFAGGNPIGGGWRGVPEPYTREINHEDQSLSGVFVTMLQQLGLDTDSFAGATGDFSELLF